MAEGSPESAEPGSLWEQLCREFELEQPSLPEGLKSGRQLVNYTSLDSALDADFSAEQALLAFSDCPSEPPNPKTCSPREYLEIFIFPVLLPGMAEMLNEAHKEQCFERKRTKFIACDFLTQWLYNYNAKRKDQQFTEFFQIPFVVEWLKDHPRPPIPLSLLLSEEEASTIIQSFWRGYRVRCIPEVQELRLWQRELRENKDIHKKVEEFWAKQESKVGREMKNTDEEHIPNHSGVSIQVLSPTPQNTVILT